MKTNNKKQIMETKINNELDLLEPFCDVNPNHPEMNTPFYHPKYKEVWATNGHILIRIPPERLVEEYNKFDRLTLPELGELCHKRLSLDALKRALDKLPTKHFTTCPECDGYGNVEWEYHDKDGDRHEMEEECPVCKGDGEILHDYVIKIGLSVFSSFYLEIVYKALRLMKADTVEVAYNSSNLALELRHNGVKINIMPLVPKAREKVDAEVELLKD